MKEVLIFGAGGHAKVVADLIGRQQKYTVKAFVVDDVQKEKFLGVDLVSERDWPTLNINHGVVAIGDNWMRSKVVANILRLMPDFVFINAVHPFTSIGANVTLHRGTVIMSGVVINAGARIGQHCIVNTGATIDHDCELKDFVSVAPGTTLGGNVTVGDFSAISLGAKVVHNIAIGKKTVIGAGSVVVDDIPDGVMAYGLPCKVRNSRREDEKYL